MGFLQIMSSLRDLYAFHFDSRVLPSLRDCSLFRLEQAEMKRLRLRAVAKPVETEAGSGFV